MRTILPLPLSGNWRPPSAKAAPGAEWRRLRKAALVNAATLLREWRRRSRDRAQLATLDERMLRDIGVSPGDVWAETSKPFWRK
jgi:uncharacterized protein YjiS (DUF1127 family)